MPPPSQMKMQCSALPFGVWTGVLFANNGEAPSAAAEVRKERRFIMVGLSRQ